MSYKDRELYDLKNRAVEYYRANGVPQEMEAVLNEMFLEKPDDVYGYLANYFSRLSSPPVIRRLLGKEVYDEKGQLTVQAEVFCTIKNEEKRAGSAMISSHGESRGGNTSHDLGSANGSDRRKDAVETAVLWINESLCAALKGLEPRDQSGVDKVLSEFYVARLLEDQERLSREKEDQPSHEPVPEPASPTTTATKVKKGREKGRKADSAGKPLPPPEPPAAAPVLPGAAAVGTVSLAVARAGAELGGVPLYLHVAALRDQQKSSGELDVPLPAVTLLSCGKRSPGKLNLMEEVMVIPGKAGQSIKKFLAVALELQGEVERIVNTVSKTGPVLNVVSDCGALVIGFDRPEQPLELITEAARNLSLVFGDVMYLAINCVAHELMDYQKGKYDVVTGSAKSPDELVELYELLTGKYPALIALIDPLRKEDREQWERLSSVLGQTYLLSEATSRPGGDPRAPPGVRGFVLKQTDEVTVTDLIEVTRQLEGMVTVVGTTDGEPCDDSLSDLAVGLGVKLVKLGGLYRGGRLPKYNRLISIEEDLAQRGMLGSGKFAFPLAAREAEGTSSAESL